MPDITDDEVWDLFQDTVTKNTIEHSELICDLSFFENAITDHSVGGISNISEYSLTLENLIGAVFAQLIRNFIVVSKKINNNLVGYNRIVFSGGIARKWNVLREGIISELNTSADIYLSENDTLYGCMKYALLTPEER